jgi:hypothetical protein
MSDKLVNFPMSDAIRARAALQAARRAKAIADSQAFDDDVVRSFLKRAERELQEASTAAGLDKKAA